MIPVLVAAVLFAADPSPAPSTSPSPVATTTPAAVPGGVDGAGDICSSGISAVVGRPTQTTTACNVNPRHAEIEAGYQAQSVRVGGGGSYVVQTLPNATIRVGTALRGLEADLFVPTLIRSGGTTFSGDVGALLKYQFPATPTVAYALTFGGTAPTGTDPTINLARNPNGLGSSNAATYQYGGFFEASLGKVFGISGGVTGYSLAAPTGSTTVTRYTQVTPSLLVSITLPSGYGAIVEGWHQSNAEGPSTPGRTWEQVVLTKTIGRAQFDVEAATSNAIVPVAGGPSIQRRYVGAGFAYFF